jgi:hypothetical protein
MIKMNYKHYIGKTRKNAKKTISLYFGPERVYQWNCKSQKLTKVCTWKRETQENASMKL